MSDGDEYVVAIIAAILQGADYIGSQGRDPHTAAQYADGALKLLLAAEESVRLKSKELNEPF